MSIAANTCIMILSILGTTFHIFKPINWRYMYTKEYDVQIYFSGFSTHIIEAPNKEEAINKARLQHVNKNELLTNIENWKEADTANEINNHDIPSII